MGTVAVPQAERHITGLQPEIRLCPTNVQYMGVHESRHSWTFVSPVLRETIAMAHRK